MKIFTIYKKEISTFLILAFFHGFVFEAMASISRQMPLHPSLDMPYYIDTSVKDNTEKIGVFNELESRVYLINEEQEAALDKETLATTESTEEKAEIVEVSTTLYPSDIIYGEIGRNGFDAPDDNLFKVEIKDAINLSARYILTYEVYGIGNAAGVTKSINTNTSMGGFFIERNKKWTRVTEYVSPYSLRKGVNTILFTSDLNNDLGYLIRNLQIEKEEGGQTDLFYINDAVKKTATNEIYVQGVVNTKDLDLQLFIDGREVLISNNGFETKLNLDLESEKEMVVEVKKKTVTLEKKSVSVSNMVEVNYNKTLDYAFNTSSYEVNTEEEQHYQLENVAITLPAASYGENFTLSIQELRASDYAPTGMALKNATVNKAAYRFLPDGIHFKKEATIKIKYDLSVLPAGYSAKDIQVFYFDTDLKQWTKVKVIDILEESNEVVAVTNHFTDYIAGVIQEPESPETNAFAPTSISGIQAANPTENIPMVSVPQINDRGDAVLHFPLQLLPARQGMLPDLSVNYNSSSDEGDFGLGWSLSVPTISVDTRWGVPVYDTSKETESYLFNGEDLLLVKSDGFMYAPHKDPLMGRVSDVLFQKMQHDPSQEITRLGNGPNEYKWKVEDSKTGWTYSYDLYSKGKWYLKTVEDVFQNKMEYFYNQNAFGDYQLQRVEYNKNDQLQYPTSDFTVQIYRKNTIDLPSVTNRKDVKINNRYGIESRSIQLIDKITIEAHPKYYEVKGWETEDVKIGFFYNEYHFLYKEGAFGRSLLQKIINKNYNNDLDDRGDITRPTSPPNIQEYVFDYYNDIGSGSLFEGTSKSIATYKDYETEHENLGVHLSALGGGEGKNQSFGGGVSAGVVLPIFPDSWLPFSRSATVGGNVGGGSSNSESKVLMVDIDGDGLPDKVFKGGSSFYYRKNLGGSFSLEVYEIKNLPNLSYSKTDSSELSFTVNIIAGSVSKSESSSVSTTSTYTADVNADGLLDVVDNERVYFGYIDPQTKKPSFNLDSSITPAIVIKEDDVAPILNPMPQLDLTNGLMDMVMIWRAPKNGAVTIAGTINKEHISLQSGVKFSIERLHESDMGAASFIEGPHLMLSSNYTHNQTQQVVKGDLLLFRVHSNQIPLEELGIVWNPRVTYLGQNLDPVMSSSRHDSSYRDGFIVGTNYEQVFKKRGKYRLEWEPFSIYDVDRVTIRVSYFKKNINAGEGGNIPVNGSNMIIHEQTSGIETTSYFSSPNLTLDMSSVSSTPTSFHYMKVEVLSDSEIDWKAIDTQFKPKLVSLDNENTDVHLIPYYSNYSRVHINNPPLHFISNGTRFTVKINNNFTLPGCTEPVCKDRYIYFTAKTGSGKIIPLVNGTTYAPIGYLKFRYKISANGTIIQKQRLNENYDYINVNNEYVYTTTSYAGAKEFFEYYSPDYALAKKLDDYQKTGTNTLVRIEGPTPYSNHANGVESNGRIQASIYSSEMNTAWGAMYRNWGQFAYKGSDPEQVYNPIVGKHIHIWNDVPITNSGETTEDFMEDTNRSLDDLELQIDEIEGLAGNVSEHFGMLLPNKEKKRWESHEHLYVSEARISPYIRFLTDEIPNLRPPTVPVQNYGAFGINKYSSFKSKSVNKSVGFLMVNAGTAKTVGSSELLNDFIDINGDGFPDIVGAKIQLTAKRGGLSSKILNVDLKTRTSIEGTGSLLGGSSAGVKGSAATGLNVVSKPTFKSVNLIVGSQGSGTLNGSSFNTTNEVDRFYVDLNGDGLVDIIQNNGTVLFNYGGVFSASTIWGNLPKPSSSTETKGVGAGGGFSAISNMDISLGISASGSTSKDKVTYMDLNGDGLPEKIINGTTYHLNTGTGFATAGRSLPGAQSQKSTEAGLNGNGTICIYFPVPLIMIGPKFCFSVGGSTGRSYSSEESRYMDFDGDGFVDYVTSSRNEGIQVYASRIKRTNLLRKVVQNTGATIELDYSVTNPIANSAIGATYKMPFKKWALTKVAVFDDYVGDGENTTRYAYEYFNGYKDRKERIFLGFGLTKAHLIDKNGQVYRTQQTEYLINSMTENELYSPGISSDLKQFIYKKGLVKSSATFDKSNNILNHKEYSYKFYDSSAITGDINTTSPSNVEVSVFTEKMSVLPLVTSIYNKEVSYNQDMNDSFTFDTEQTFRLYDRKGNVKEYRDLDRGITVNMDYSLGTKTLPILHSVVATSGQQLRLMKGIVANNGVTYSKIQKYSNATNYTTTMLEYNNLGNLAKKTFPGGFYYKYEYENTLSTNNGMYGFDGNYYKVVPSRISDSFGNVSETIVNAAGLPVRSRDVYGVRMRYVYDPFNRLLEFQGPYESEWTIRNEFVNNRIAITSHNIGQGDILHTSMINDGLGRTIQVKKQLEIDEELELCWDEYPSYRLAVSGAIKYDEFGRVIENYLAEEEIVCSDSGTLRDLLETPYTPPLDSDKKVERLYDHKDRVIEEFVFGTSALTQIKYGFGKDYYDTTQFSQEVILPEGNKTISYTDKFGLLTSQKQLGAAPLWTSYEYDKLGQVEEVKNAMSHSTSYTYDLLGQVLKRDSDASGITTYKYDDLGNLIVKEDANGTTIEYSYDFNRLRHIDHPSIETRFEYDQGGRVIMMKDHTGYHEYKYGSLGEVIQDTKMISSASGDRYFTTKYKYDSWGRILEMIYPDREMVFYRYNKVGQLVAIRNEEGVYYLRDVHYTHFDQPHYIRYGNYVETRQEFDVTERLRASTFFAPNSSSTSDLNVFSRNVYRFDKNNNITGVYNNYSQHDVVNVGGTSKKTYKYDEYNRLSMALGDWQGLLETHEYELNMTYNNDHSIASKDQIHSVFDINTASYSHTDNSLSRTYSYADTSKPRLTSIDGSAYAGGSFIQDFSYLPNGNISKIENAPSVNQNSFSSRSFEWDANNNIVKIEDDGSYINEYSYDGVGERVIKRLTGGNGFSINGSDPNNGTYGTSEILYPSGNLVYTENSFTKHYYANGKRIASSIKDSERADYFRDANYNSGRVTPHRGSAQYRTQGQAESKVLKTSSSSMMTQRGMNLSGTPNYQVFNAPSPPSFCRDQIDVLLQVLYNTAETIDCKIAILNILESHRTPSGYNYCAALEEINTLACVERTEDGQIIDPVTGYVYDPITGHPYDPITGLPIDLGTGGSVNGYDQAQLDCYNKLIEFIYFYENRDDKPASYYAYERYVKCHMYEPGWCSKLDYIRAEIDYCDFEIPELPEPETPRNPYFPDRKIDIGAGVDDTWEDEAPDETIIRANPTVQSSPIWWYHSDHLGSSSYITDVLGKPVQYYEYLPFGEIMVQQSTNNIFENVYKFNGKELDEQTGYYYYGARYYDPGASIFLSVDPLAEKYPGYNPYIYTFNDPINYVDPDGRDGVRVIDRQNKTITIKATYFVQTEGRPIRGGQVAGYSSNQISAMSSSINNWYNEQNLSVNEGEFEGYNIRFDLTFKDGGNSLQTKLKSNAEQYEGHNVGNSLERGSEDTHRNLFTTEIQPNGSVNEVGGVTEKKKSIMMNSKHDNDINRIHEVGHTLGLDDNKNTGAKGGLMAYPPEKMTQKEANQLGNGSFLPKVQ